MKHYKEIADFLGRIEEGLSELKGKIEDGYVTKRYLNHKEASRYLSTTPGGLYKLGDRRMVPYGKRGSKRIYDRHNIDILMDECHKKGGVTLEEAIDTFLRKGAWL